jgi:hypothetical protein
MGEELVEKEIGLGEVTGRVDNFTTRRTKFDQGVSSTDKTP